MTQTQRMATNLVLKIREEPLRRAFQIESGESIAIVVFDARLTLGDSTCNNLSFGPHRKSQLFLQRDELHVEEGKRKPLILTSPELTRMLNKRCCAELFLCGAV
jgi:hypothetical protein